MLSLNSCSAQQMETKTKCRWMHGTTALRSRNNGKYNRHHRSMPHGSIFARSRLKPELLTSPCICGGRKLFIQPRIIPTEAIHQTFRRKATQFIAKFIALRNRVFGGGLRISAKYFGLSSQATQAALSCLQTLKLHTMLFGAVVSTTLDRTWTTAGSTLCHIHMGTRWANSGLAVPDKRNMNIATPGR